VITTCLALAGCGGDAGEKKSGSAKARAANPASQASKPKQDIDEFAQLLETAITSPDCKGLKTKVNKPTQGGIEIACPAEVAKVGKAYAGYQTRGAESYGSGALIDYESAEAPDGGTWELSLGGDGTWVIDAGKITEERTVGTEFEKREDFDRVLDRFLGAVSEGDCDSFFKYSETYTEDKREACKEELPLYDALATALKADPDAKPFFIGGNGRYAFYGLETTKPRPVYRTVTVQETSAGAKEPYLVARTTVGPTP